MKIKNLKKKFKKENFLLSKEILKDLLLIIKYKSKISCLFDDLKDEPNLYNYDSFYLQSILFILNKNKKLIK